MGVTPNFLMCASDLESNPVFRTDLESFVPGLSTRLRLHRTHPLLRSKLRYYVQKFSCSRANSGRPTLTCGECIVANPTSTDRNVFGKVDELFQIASNLLKTTDRNMFGQADEPPLLGGCLERLMNSFKLPPFYSKLLLLSR